MDSPTLIIYEKSWYNKLSCIFIVFSETWPSSLMYKPSVSIDDTTSTVAEATSDFKNVAWAPDKPPVILSPKVGVPDTFSNLIKPLTASKEITSAVNPEVVPDICSSETNVPKTFVTIPFVINFNCGGDTEFAYSYR